jgi:archaeal flagellar protein FlaJ
MAIKDFFGGKSKESGEAGGSTSWQAESLKNKQQAPAPEKSPGRLAGLSQLLKKDKTAKADLGPGEVTEFAQEQEEIVRKIEKYQASQHGFRLLMRHPVRVLTRNPINTLYITIPVGILFFLIGTAYIFNAYGLNALYLSTVVDDLAIFTFLIIAVPLAVLDFKESSRRRHIEEALPNFFRDLAGMNDSGMTLPNAVHLVAQSDYSTLTPYVRRLDNEMSWNVTFIEAIQRFRLRLATPLTDRSIDLIAKASKAGGDVSEVLRAAASDSYEFISLRIERRNNMLIYIVIVLISFFVFVFVIYILVTTFLTVMATAGSAAAGVGGGAASFGGAIDLALYGRLFAHAAILQGLFSGLVAGQMGEGRAVAGLKYSIIMVLIAWIMFRFFV